MMSSRLAGKITPSIDCVVIQIEDLAQTLSSLLALKACKSAYPQLRLHLIVREESAEAVQRVEWIDQVSVLPARSMKESLKRGEKNKDDLLRDLATFARPWVQKRWNIVVNWSSRESASYLCALIPAQLKLGLTRKEDLTLCAPDGWTQYLQGIVHAGTHQNIHPTDIQSTQLLTALHIHAGEPAPCGDQPATSAAFFNAQDRPFWGIELGNHWIAVELMPSRVELITAFAQDVFRNRPEYRLLLLSRKNQPELETQFLEKIRQLGLPEDRILSLTGENNFELLSSVLSRSEVVISEDPVLAQHAAILNASVIWLAQDVNRWNLKSPYGNGNWIYTQDPDSKALFDLIFHKRTEQPSLYRSRIRRPDEGGGLVFDSQISRPLQLQEWCALILGDLARLWYCGWVPPVGHEIKRTEVQPALLAQIRSLDQQLSELREKLRAARLQALSLHQKSKKLKSERIMDAIDREEIQVFASALSRLECEIDAICLAVPCLRAFSQMAKVMMHNLEGDSLFEVSQESATAYGLLLEGVEHFRKWVRHTQELAKPRTIRTPGELLELR